MDGAMERIAFLLHVRAALTLLTSLQTPLLLGFLLYQSAYPFIVLQALGSRALGLSGSPPLTPASAPAVLLVLPTLLRTRGELAGMKRAISSVVQNGYPGQLVIVAAIDAAALSAQAYRELLTWMALAPRPANVSIFATSTPRRTGKAVLIDRAVSFVRAKVERGELGAFPPVFFNMDGDSFLGPAALERMVRRLVRPRWFGRLTTRPTIVTSNVQIDPRAYWRGWRPFFTLRGQIAVSVAREYLTSITVGKYNGRILPVTEASGALYCTWSELLERAPRWAAFLQTLTVGDWLRWWLGVAPPSFDRSTVTPRPEAMTGPGDDTWVTWLACCARYSRSGALVLELPRTPAHAFFRLLFTYVCRPVSYEPRARLHTKTPITARGLFAQRVRWNSSRLADLQRWAPGFAFHWSPAVPVVLWASLNLYVHAAITWALLVWPFTHARSGAIASFVLAAAFTLVVRGACTLFAAAVDGQLRQGARTLLALPLALPYHLAFNMLPTVVGITEDILLLGVNTRFSPEETLVASGLSRIALAYRLRRALRLAWRSVVHGDVPLGWFWLGWGATPWTTNGFHGWTNGTGVTPGVAGPPGPQAKVTPHRDADRPPPLRPTDLAPQLSALPVLGTVDG